MKFIWFFTFLLCLLFDSPAFAAQSFKQWKQAYANRASKRGLPKHFVLKTLSNIKIDPEVTKKYRNQIILNKTIDYQKFIKKWLRQNPSRIEKGRKVLGENLVLLEKIEKKYGVEKEVIVSLWGVETLYGEITGEYDLIRSLATLAYNSRRKRFFEIQLNASLKLLKKGNVTRENLKGSWAGATGQCQFMPSNINIYAKDFNEDGKKDIWSTKADIFASIANYLKRVGWQNGKSIGSLAISTRNFESSLERYRTQSQYNRLGFRNLSGSSLKGGRWVRRRAALIPMDNSPVVLRGSNYQPILRWNKSSLFAALNILLINSFKHPK